MVMTDDGMQHGDDDMRHVDDGMQHGDDGMRHVDDGMRHGDDGMQHGDNTFRNVWDTEGGKPTVAAAFRCVMVQFIQESWSEVRIISR